MRKMFYRLQKMPLKTLQPVKKLHKLFVFVNSANPSSDDSKHYFAAKLLTNFEHS